MRVMNLMILLAIIALLLLIVQYVSQLQKNRHGNNFVSGGQVFFNWALVIVLVISIGGIVMGGFQSRHQEAKATQKESVKYTASSSDALGPVSVQFDRKVKLDENGEAKVTFKVSPQTTLTIRGHKTKNIVQTFKASKGQSLAKHSYTFDVAGTYDIIAQRGDQKVTKKLKVEANGDLDSSSSSEISSSAVSSSSSSRDSSSSSSATSTSSSSTTNNNSSASSSTTATSRNGGTGNSYRGTSRGTYQPPRSNGNADGSNGGTQEQPSASGDTPVNNRQDDGYGFDNNSPQY